MSICGTWVPDVEAVTCACSVDDLGDLDPSEAAELLAKWSLIASGILYARTGRQYPGVCVDSVRPCSGIRGGQVLSYGDGLGSRPLPIHSPSGLGGCEGGPGCGIHSSVLLPHRPVRKILSVDLGGELLDPSSYTIVNRRWLVRSSGSWPCSQNLGLHDGELGTWTVTYEYGVRPPDGGPEMAAMYGCQLALGCIGSDDCRLPRRVTNIVREGVSMTLLDPQEFLNQGRTGLEEVDAWVSSLNPTGMDRAGKVISPDLLGTRRVR